MADETTRLEESEGELVALAAHLHTVVPPDLYRIVVLTLGHRSWSLFLGFGDLIQGRAPAAALALGRPMVEINLTLRFLSEDPDLHVELWLAEGDRQRLALYEEYARATDLHHRHLPLPADLKEISAEMRKTVKEARRKALAARVIGVREKRGPVFPSIAEIVRSSNDLAAKEAYTLAYRSLGWNVHVGQASFRGEGFQQRVGGLVSYSDEWTAEMLLPLRTLVVTTFASTLSMVSIELGLGVHEQADEIKQRFMVEGEPPIAERIAETLANHSEGPRDGPTD